MSSVMGFKLVLLSLGAMIGLQLLAKRLRLPPAAALLVGGAAMAFVPGLPRINLDPELVLVVFLPPLLMDGAYFSVWDEFKRNFGGILLLAIGAVAFTTLAVGLVVHWVVPSLPWSACFALGAVVSPPVRPVGLTGEDGRERPAPAPSMPRRIRHRGQIPAERSAPHSGQRSGWVMARTPSSGGDHRA